MISAVLLAMIAAFMLAGAIGGVLGLPATIFRSPVFVLLLGLLAASILTCAARRRLRWRQAGFYLTHLGVVVILAGALLGYLGEVTGELVLLTGEHQPAAELESRDGRALSLDFEVSLLDFSVLRYAPDYVLRRSSAAQADGEAAPDPQTSGQTVRISPEGVLDLGELGVVDAGKLRAGGEPERWRRRCELGAGWVLHMLPQTVREYRARLRFTGSDGAAVEREAAVNHPAVYRGWRFYLVSGDLDFGRHAVLLARRDPGRNTVAGGMLAVMVGVALTCLLRSGGTHVAD